MTVFDYLDKMVDYSMANRRAEPIDIFIFDESVDRWNGWLPALGDNMPLFAMAPITQINTLWYRGYEFNLIKL